MDGRSFLDYMPEQASTWASRVDFINNFITYVSAFCTVALTGVMLYFAWKYRRRPGNTESSFITHNAQLETVWTVIPTLVCIFVCYYGFAIYYEMRNPPASSIEINVEGYKWGWNFTYSNGKKAGRDMVVPVGKPIKLILKSLDVNHSFFLPSMRIKEDLVKSEYHYLWFTPTVTGTFPIYCAEYCGQGHSGMLGSLKVVTEAEFNDYLADRSSEVLSPEELGAKLYTQKACITCHTLDGTKLIGPSFKGIFGQTVSCEDGATFTRDENYLRESILYSNKHVVKGFAPVMPAFEGQLKDDEVLALIAFIKAQSK